MQGRAAPGRPRRLDDRHALRLRPPVGVDDSGFVGDAKPYVIQAAGVQRPAAVVDEQDHVQAQLRHDEGLEPKINDRKKIVHTN